MSFTFYSNIPAAANNPSFDQPNMLQNNESTAGIIEVDHVGFNTASGGTHLQVNFSSKNSQGAQTDPSSVLYTGNGTESTIAELYYKNQNATLQISCIKAFGYFDNNGNPIGTPQNISCSKTSTGLFAMTVSPNVVASNHVVIFVSNNNAGNSFSNYSNIVYGGGTLTFNVNIWVSNASGTRTDNSFSVMVLQL